MKTIRWIVSDLDGTLFNDQKEISQFNQEMVKALFEHSVPFGIVTGRPVQQVADRFQKLGLSPYLSFIIGMNGGSFLNLSTQKIQVFHPLEFPTIQTILEHYQDLDLCFQVLENTTRYVNRSTPRSLAYTHRCKEEEEIVDFLSYCRRHPILKLMIYCDPEKMDAVVQRAKTLSLPKCRGIQTDDCMFEWMDQRIHKGAALEYAAEVLDLPLSSCLAFGDADNDLEIFERVGVGICAHNGTSKVKEKATIVSAFTNEEDFVGRTIQTLITNDFQW